MSVGSGRRDSVLIIDDSPEDCEMYARYLDSSSRHSYHYRTAETVDDGLALCHENPPQCVLLDYSLPDGTGLDFLTEAARRFAPNAFAVLVLTGYGSEEIAVEVLQHGATDYLPKRRVNPESLCRSVHRAIERNDLLRMLRDEQEEKDALIEELRQALVQVKRLSGLLPICAHCKKVRDDTGYWHQVEVYIRHHSEADFSHGVCPECAHTLYPELYDQGEKRKAGEPEGREGDDG